MNFEQFRDVYEECLHMISLSKQIKKITKDSRIDTRLFALDLKYVKRILEKMLKDINETLKKDIAELEKEEKRLSKLINKR